MKHLSVLVLLFLSSLLNVNSQTIDNYTKGYIYYFGDTIECNSWNAYSIFKDKAVRSDFLGYSNSVGLDCFFFFANNVSKNIREKVLEDILQRREMDIWKREELDSAFNYFKRTYPQNVNLLKIEKQLNIQKSLCIGQKSPDLSFTTLDNNTEFHLSDFKNKPVLLKLLGLDWVCRHESNSEKMNEILRRIVMENNTPAFKDVQVLNVFMTNHKDEWTPTIPEPDKFKTTLFFANDPDSVYSRFGCMGGATYLIDKSGRIVTNRSYYFDHQIQLLKLNNWLYKPNDSPYEFAKHLLMSSIKNSLTSDIFVPYDTLKELDKKGYLRMRDIKIREDYNADYMTRFIKLLEYMNRFKRDKVVIQKVNFKSYYDDKILDCIQIIFQVNKKDLYELLIPSCINYNGKWGVFSGFPLFTSFSYQRSGKCKPLYY